MPKIWNYKLGSEFLALLCSLRARIADAAPEEKTVSIGRIKWAVYDAATSRLLSDGVREKTLQASDVKILTYCVSSTIDTNGNQHGVE